jgi:phosphoserine phosphatase
VHQYAPIGIEENKHNSLLHGKEYSTTNTQMGSFEVCALWYNNAWFLWQLFTKQRIAAMRMIIVRHGESEWNRIHRYQGQLDAPLSALGLRQADALAERLKNEEFDIIYTSRLQRAALTAKAIAKYHAAVPYVEDEALLEIKHGDWEGRFAHEIAELYADGLAEWREHPTRSQMPNGESFSNILKRTLDFKEQTIKRHTDATILVSTHDVVVKILVADALGMDMDRINRIWVTNASISVIEYGDDLPYLVSLSEACHLGQLASTREGQKAI